MNASTIVIADPNARFRSKAAQHIGRDGYVEAQDTEEAARILTAHDGEPAVLVLGPTIPAAEKIELAKAIQVEAPAVSVVLVAGKLTASFLQQAMRAGVKDVLPTSCTSQQFKEAVERAEALAEQLVAVSPHRASRPAGTGRVTTVFSAKGGCGKSVLSTNLGILLAERTGGDVALVDLDLDSGDLAIMMRLDPTRTIYDAAVNLDRLDAEALKSYMTKYSDNVALLAAPLEPGLGEKITPEAVRRMLSMLRETYTHVVVDGPSFFTEQVLASLDESDDCILVASLDVPSVKNLKVALRTFNLLGFDRSRVRLVLNRADSKVGLSVEEVEKALQTDIEMLIPSSRDVPLCVNRGVPIASAVAKSSVTSAIGRLADVIRGTREPAPTGAPERERSRPRHNRFRGRKGTR